MSKQYMQIVSGRPTGSALSAEKMAGMFPGHDFAAGAPNGYAEYEPTPRPVLQRFQKIDIELLLQGGKVVDVLTVRTMTADEKAIAIEIKRRDFVARTGWNSWTYDEDLDQFVPPFSPPLPVPNGIYAWNETAQGWDLTGVREETN